MVIFQKIVMFLVGGAGYVGLELLWRGRSHISMFLAGGVCFLILGKLNRLVFPPAVKCLLGAVAITCVELTAGLLANRTYRVWDYRQLPFNYKGHICLIYSLLWIPVSLGAMLLYGCLEKRLRRTV